MVFEYYFIIIASFLFLLLGVWCKWYGQRVDPKHIQQWLIVTNGLKYRIKMRISLFGISYWQYYRDLGGDIDNQVWYIVNFNTLKEAKTEIEKLINKIETEKSIKSKIHPWKPI